MKWHDGQPFTAHDVAFTFNRIIYNDDIPASSRPAFTFRYLEGGEWTQGTMTVTALDDYTVLCELPVSFAPFLRSMGTAIYPKHILGTVRGRGHLRRNMGHLDRSCGDHRHGAVHHRAIRACGAGGHEAQPQLLAQGTTTAIPLPYLDEIIHIIVPDLETELIKFRAGETDVHGVLGEEFATLEPLQEEENFTIHKRGPNFGTTFLVFNMNSGTNPETGEPYVDAVNLRWFQEKQFRHAVAHSMDKDAIIEDIQHGLGYPAVVVHQPFGRGLP